MRTNKEIFQKYVTGCMRSVSILSSLKVVLFLCYNFLYEIFHNSEALANHVLCDLNVQISTSLLSSSVVIICTQSETPAP